MLCLFSVSIFLFSHSFSFSFLYFTSPFLSLSLSLYLTVSPLPFTLPTLSYPIHTILPYSILSYPILSYLTLPLLDCPNDTLVQAVGTLTAKNIAVSVAAGNEGTYALYVLNIKSSHYLSLSFIIFHYLLLSSAFG